MARNQVGSVRSRNATLQVGGKFDHFIIFTLLFFHSEVKTRKCECLFSFCLNRKNTSVVAHLLIFLPHQLASIYHLGEGFGVHAVNALLTFSQPDKKNITK